MAMVVPMARVVALDREEGFDGQSNGHCKEATTAFFSGRFVKQGKSLGHSFAVGRKNEGRTGAQSSESNSLGAQGVRPWGGA